MLMLIFLVIRIAESLALVTSYILIMVPSAGNLLSSGESELYASRAACWFSELLGEIGFRQRTIDCFEDNKGVVDWISTPKASSRMLHLELEYYWLRDVSEIGRFRYILISTLLQKADILTKQMDPTLLHTLLRMLYNLA